jgi:hypothetical protein
MADEAKAFSPTIPGFEGVIIYFAVAMLVINVVAIVCVSCWMWADPKFH